MNNPDSGRELRFENVIIDPNEQSRIGPAWRLFLLIYYRSDDRGFLKLTHRQLERLLNANLWTIRAWRRHLCEKKVIDSIANSRSVFFYLHSPWLDIKRGEVREKEQLIGEHVT